jgi:hypothetical protein
METSVQTFEKSRTWERWIYVHSNNGNKPANLGGGGQTKYTKKLLKNI